MPAAAIPSSTLEQSAMKSCSGYLSRTSRKKSAKARLPGRVRLVASRAITSTPHAAKASTSVIVGVIYTSGWSSYTFLIMPMIGRSTFFRLSSISSTVLARIPAAPPPAAASAMRPMMKELWRGSSGSAWQDTINLPLTCSKNALLSITPISDTSQQSFFVTFYLS